LLAAGNRHPGLRVPIDEPTRGDIAMNGPTFEVPKVRLPRLRLSFVAMTAPPSIWVHGFAAENDNDAREDHVQGGLPRLLISSLLPPRRPS